MYNSMYNVIFKPHFPGLYIHSESVTHVHVHVSMYNGIVKPHIPWSTMYIHMYNQRLGVYKPLVEFNVQ